MTTVAKLISDHPALTPCETDINSAFLQLKTTYQNGGKVLVCGNGGSAADSEHIVGELMKGFMQQRKIPEATRAKIKAVAEESGEYICNNLQGALPAISLVSQSAIISAFANDVAADMVFAQQVYGYGKPGDCLIGLSTSGNAKNVVFALHTAKALGLATIGLTGSSGGALKSICDVTVCAPSDSTPKIQEFHLPIYHTLCMMIEEEFF